jgi:DNA-binding NarL/FixJ family response regulator
MARELPVTVLLVENGPEMRTLLRSRFGLDDRFMVLEDDASNGDEAVGLCATWTPDVVILDIMMPGRDGVDALPEIRRVAPDAKIIVYSAGLPEETEAAALGAGAHAVVSKNEPLEELVRAVERVLPDLPPSRTA